MWPCNPAFLMAAATVWCASIVVHGGEPVGATREADAAQLAQALPPGNGEHVVRASCTPCHGPALIAQQRLSRDGWSREVDKMVGWGATVAEVERDGLLSYLTTHFGVDSPAAPVETDEYGAALLKSRCQACHGLQLIEQQRLDATGWRREVDKMIGWGVALTDPEKDALVAHLARRGLRSRDTP